MIASERKPLYEQLERLRESRILVYFLGDRRGLETKISSEVLDIFAEHLDKLPDYNGKISLFLYARGGDTLAAWSISNLIRQFCAELEVIVPGKAHSAATLICLSANRILMTKQATLGPIDPSVNTALNPGIPGAPPEARYSVSVEAIRGFIDMAKQEFSIDSSSNLTEVLGRLVEHVHPLVLGQVFRTQQQIRDLASRLLSHHLENDDSKKEIVDFLCGESGSHDYTINRNEALDLGLPVEIPDEKQYRLIHDIYQSFGNELELRTPFSKTQLVGTEESVDYSATRGIIESSSGGCDAFISEGVLQTKQRVLDDGIVQDVVEERKTFEGWRHI